MIPLPADLACPVATPESAVTVEIVTTAEFPTKWGSIVDKGHTCEGMAAPFGGAGRSAATTCGQRDDQVMEALVGLIHHPAGLVTVDAGLGRTTRDGTYPKFPYSSFPIETDGTSALVDLLAGVTPLLTLLTHPHYDHVGGLFDLPGAKVWISEGDWSAYGHGKPGFPRRLRENVEWLPQSFASAATVMDRPAIDVLGDGTIWYLSTPGHTPGETAVLVRAADHPWLFIGDTAWVDEHLYGGHRPWLIHSLVDAKPKRLTESLEWARWFYNHCPDVQVVAGHEPRWVAARSSAAR